MKSKPHFDLPVIAPALTGEAIVVFAILIMVCFNASAIAEWMQ